VQIGALVSGGGYRNPDLLADMARTVDHISGGRLIFGIGGGWFEKDYDEYGYPFGTPGSRLNLLGENLARITARWERLNPPPLRPIPVLIGGGGERKTLRHVARYATIWHAFGGPDTQARKAAILAEHCAAVGRDPGQIERSTAVPRGGAADAKVLLDLGVTLFTIGVSGPNYDLAVVPQWVKWRNARNKDREP
jgi:probable F420-dependent oxidoreductase